jgi:signal transduction histidine kinase
MRFQQLAEHIQGVFYLTDRDNGQMLYVSPAYEAIWVAKAEKSLYADSRSWVDAVLLGDRERVRAAREKGSITGSFDEEYRISRPDSTIRWDPGPQFSDGDETGAIYRVPGIAEDITEMRKAEEELRLTNEKLRQLSVRLLAMREEEPRRVAREIHDELWAMLTALSGKKAVPPSPRPGADPSLASGRTFRFMGSALMIPLFCEPMMSAAARYTRVPSPAGSGAGSAPATLTR